MKGRPLRPWLVPEATCFSGRPTVQRAVSACTEPPVVSRQHAALPPAHAAAPRAWRRTATRAGTTPPLAQSLAVPLASSSTRQQGCASPAGCRAAPTAPATHSRCAGATALARGGCPAAAGAPSLWCCQDCKPGVLGPVHLFPKACCRRWEHTRPGNRPSAQGAQHRGGMLTDLPMDLAKSALGGSHSQAQGTGHLSPSIWCYSLIPFALAGLGVP